MWFEDYLCERLDRNWGKEKLYLRAHQVVKENKGVEWANTFKKNMLSAYLALLTSSSIIDHINISSAQVKEGKWKFSKTYHNSFLDNLRDETWEPTDEYRNMLDQEEQAIEFTQQRYNKFQSTNWYQRSNSYQPSAHRESIFKEKMKNLFIESFLFNRLYEMMMTQMIEAYLSQDFPEYQVKAYKTTSYDDLISGVDIIVHMQQHGWWALSIWIDHVCGVSAKNIEEKWDKGHTACCREYNSSIRQGNYSSIPRIVWSSNPWISFLLFEWYLSKIVNNEPITNKKLIDVYYEIQESHPELYKESLEFSSEIHNNDQRIKDALLHIFNK